jgi:hypothetical protein
LKPKLEQEKTDTLRAQHVGVPFQGAESFFSVSSAISCSNPFVRVVHAIE